MPPRGWTSGGAAGALSPEDVATGPHTMQLEVSHLHRQSQQGMGTQSSGHRGAAPPEKGLQAGVGMVGEATKQGSGERSHSRRGFGRASHGGGRDGLTAAGRGGGGRGWDSLTAGAGWLELGGRGETAAQQGERPHSRGDGLAAGGLDGHTPCGGDGRTLRGALGTGSPDFCAVWCH